MQNNDFDIKVARDFGQVFNSTFEFIRQEYKFLLKVIILYAGPFLLLSSISYGIYTGNIFSALSNRYNNPILSDPFGVGRMFSSIYWWGYVVLGFLGKFVIILTINSYIKLYIERGRNNFSYEDVSAEMSYNGFEIFITSIILGIVYFVVSIPAVLTLEVGLLYIWISTSFVLLIRQHEEKSLTEAIRKSFKLANSNCFATFGLIILLYVITSIVGYMFLFPQTILSLIWGILNIQGKEFNATIWSTILTAFGTFFTQLVILIVFVGKNIQYYSLIERTECPALLKKIDEINSNA